MSSHRRPLGEDFAPPDRAAGLRAMLSATPSPPDEPLPRTSDRPEPEESIEQHRNENVNGGGGPDSGRLTLVVVYLSNSVHRALREQAANSGRSYTDMALDAVEAHLPELTERWKSAPTNAPGVLFARRQPTRPRREEPTRQVQLRLQADAANTLRQLVADIGAPSTTALVNEALRRALLPTPT